MPTKVLNGVAVSGDETISGDLTVNGQTYSGILRTRPLIAGIGPDSVTSGMFAAPFVGGMYAWTDGVTVSSLKADDGLLSYVCGVDGGIAFSDFGPGSNFAFSRGIRAQSCVSNRGDVFALQLLDSAATNSFEIDVTVSGVNTTYTLGKGGTVAYSLTINSLNAITHAFSGTVTFANAVAANGTMSLNGSLYENGVLTPTAISASQNNYAPTGIAACINVRLSASATGLSITGIGGGSTGRKITLWNIGSNPISLPHDSASSTASNRFYCPANAAFSLRANAAVDIWYDTLSSRWRVMAS